MCHELMIGVIFSVMPAYWPWCFRISGITTSG